MYIFLVLLSAIFLGCYEIFKKVGLKKSSVYEVLFLYCLCGFILSLMFIKDALDVSFVGIGLLFIKSCIIVVNWILVMKAMEKLDVGVTTPFGLFTSILVMILSYFIYDEKITLIHLGSMFFIGLGIFLVTKIDSSENRNKGHFLSYVYLILGTSLGAISSLLDKYLIDYKGLDFKSILFWFFLFNSLIYGVIYYVKEKKIDIKKIRDNYWVLFIAISIFLADVTYYLSIGCDNAQLSLISILRKLSIVVATILASVFLKEKNLLKKIGILFLMLIGVALPVIF